jgi:hypothetical protein
VRRRTAGRALLAVVGIALIAYLVERAGPARVARIIQEAGRWLPVVVALELVQPVGDFVSLRSILRERWRHVPASTWVRSSALAYALMILVPAGRAAGEVARATFLARHIGAPRAAAASTQLQAAYLAANGLLSAAAWAAVASRFGAGSPLALLLAANVAFQACIATGLLAILRNGRLGRWLDRQRRRFVPGAVPSPPLDPTARRRMPWGALGASTFARAAQLVQYGVILHAVGGVVTIRNAFIAHGIHLVGATLGDLLPNQIGVVDGTYLAFAPALGLGPTPARALSIAFVAHIAQLVLAALCVAVVVLARRAGPSAIAALRRDRAH